MESRENQFTKIINISNDEFILIMSIVASKLKILIKNEESIEHFEREFSFKELNEFKAFLLFDSLEEIFTALNENVNSKEKISLEYNSVKDVDLIFEFSYLSKKIPVQFTLEKKQRDTNFLIEYILEDLKKIKRESKELRNENKELRNEINKIIKLKCKIFYLNQGERNYILIRIKLLLFIYIKFYFQVF
jgi:hypothetical protein